MHSSRMRTARSFTKGVYLPGACVPAWGVCTCQGVHLPGGVYLPGGVPVRGMHLPGGCTCPGVYHVTYPPPCGQNS